jgi:2-aminoadipate transaminase
MRLNFSGVSDEEIREGVRRIGKVISEQVELYSTLTHAEPPPASGAARADSAREEDEGQAKVVPLRQRRAGGR